MTASGFPFFSNVFDFRFSDFHHDFSTVAMKERDFVCENQIAQTLEDDAAGGVAEIGGVERKGATLILCCIFAIFACEQIMKLLVSPNIRII